MIVKEHTLDTFRHLLVCGLQMSLKVGSVPALNDLWTVPAPAAEHFLILFISNREYFEFLPDRCTF